MVLRVEIFRHGDEVYYGRVTSQVNPWYVRLCSRIRGTPGNVVMKSKFGTLEFDRRYGDADEVYDLISTVICKDQPYDNIKNQCRQNDRVKDKFTRAGGSEFVPVAFEIESWSQALEG